MPTKPGVGTEGPREDYLGATAGQDAVAKAPEHRHVRPPEAVDGLLLIPDYGEGGILILREEIEQLGLDGVRVLELVDEEGLPPPLVVFPHLLVLQCLQGVHLEV